MTVWGALVAFTVVTALAHAAIAATVVRGPSRTRLRPRGPAVVAGAVFLTSAAHHGVLAATLLVADPALREATPRGLPGPWAALAVAAAAAVTALWYLGMRGRPGMRGRMGRRRPDGVLLHPPAMFGAAVLDAAPDATMITDLATGELVWTSRDPWEMVGWSPGEAARRGAPDLRALVVEADRVRVRASDAEVADLDDGESVILRFRVYAPGGGHLWLSRRTTPFARDRSGVARQALSVVRDVSAIVDAEHRLEHAALHDPLTGLPNRSLLHDRLTSAVRRAARAGTEVVVLFCDLDGFKHVNDTEGHAFGDAVLVEVARRLGELVRGSDTVARVGGDEFVVVVEPPVDDPHPPREVAGLLAERIRIALSEPFPHAGTGHSISASIGMTVASSGRTAEELLRDADLAMYRAKERGRNRVEEFDDVLRADLVERGRVEHLLRTALAGRVGPPRPGAALSVAYQPVHDLDTGDLVGFEALARLHDAHGHPVPAGVFVPVAEDAGLITALGGAVLDDALAALVRRRARFPGEPPVWMSVNLSVRQVQHSDMAATVRKALDEHGLEPGDLTLEVTESVLLTAGSSALHQLTELGEAGVGVAIDDFGTGYASLTYLVTLPVTAVKIDRSFTAGMTTDPTRATIVRTVAQLASELGLRCVVEGIESRSQLDALPPGLLGQGYLLGRPGPDPGAWCGARRPGPAGGGRDSAGP